MPLANMAISRQLIASDQFHASPRRYAPLLISAVIQFLNSIIASLSLLTQNAPSLAVTSRRRRSIRILQVDSTLPALIRQIATEAAVIDNDKFRAARVPPAAP